MKYLAQILVRPNTGTHEIKNNRRRLYLKFKALFIKKESLIIQESFSVPDFLEQINNAFKNVGITNLVRIAHDDTDFYIDNVHKPDDLDGAIKEFGNLIKNSFERFFEEISVMLEYKESDIYYLIELILLRVHPVGQYPVQIIFTCLPGKQKKSYIEPKIKEFVYNVEQSLHKYIGFSEITTSFVKRSGSLSAAEDEEEDLNITDASSKGIKKTCSFFPLYGVVLGETTVKELAKLGTKAKDFDSDKKLYKYFTVKDIRFWHNDSIANHIYITYTSPIPKQWLECGFNWSLSYNEWLKLMENLGFFISIVKAPIKEWYNGKRTLSAEFNAIKKINSEITITFELDFNYSQKTSTDSNNTLYSIRVLAG